MTHQDVVNKREEEKWRWRVDAERNVIIGQCELKEDKATRGFMSKQADTVCTGNMQPCVWKHGPLSHPESQWETGESGHTVGHILLFWISRASCELWFKQHKHFVSLYFQNTIYGVFFIYYHLILYKERKVPWERNQGREMVFIVELLW